MLTFRRFTLLFFLCLLALNLAGIFGCDTGESFFCLNLPWLYTGLISTYFGVSILMAFVPSSGFHYPAICAGKTTEMRVALTFDDGPDSSKTPALLDVLKQHQVPAAFFFVGRRIAPNEDLVRRADADGHIIGSHTWSHSTWFDFFTPAGMKRELLSCTEEIARITGKTPLLFRPPYGVINPMLARALRKLPLTVICWSIRSFDTVSKDPSKTLRRIMKGLHPGAVILLHDHSEFTAGMTGLLVDNIRNAGYRIVPLDELLEINAYAS